MNGLETNRFVKIRGQNVFQSTVKKYCYFSEFRFLNVQITLKRIANFLPLTLEERSIQVFQPSNLMLDRLHSVA